MKQTNNWEEVDKIVESFFKNEITFGETKELLHQELTNLLKTVAEAMPKKVDIHIAKNDYDAIGIQSFNSTIDQIISNISEKYPEFKELVKGK